MIHAAALSLTLLASSTAYAAEAPEQSASAAVDTAVRACEQWLLEPATWSASVSGFPQQSGLGAKGLRAQDQVPDFALPPPALRQAMHFWHVPVGGGGLFVTVSDTQPFCHVVGGGGSDMQPSIVDALSSDAFAKRWKTVDHQTRQGMKTTTFQNAEDGKLSMIVSHAAAAGDRTDRPQLIITSQYDVGN